MYLDVLGMAITRGAPFDSLFASDHLASFTAVLQVAFRTSSPNYMSFAIVFIVIARQISIASLTPYSAASAASQQLQRRMACWMLPGIACYNFRTSCTILRRSFAILRCHLYQHHPDTIKRHEQFPMDHEARPIFIIAILHKLPPIFDFQTSNILHNDMLTKWVNVLLPYGQSLLAERQEHQAELDDEKAKVYSTSHTIDCSS